MYRFIADYYPYLILNALALFFLFASVLGIPGEPDTSKYKKLILDIWRLLLIVAFKGIPILAGLAFITFIFHFEKTGKIISYINFILGLSMLSLIMLYWNIKTDDKTKN